MTEPAERLHKSGLPYRPGVGVLVLNAAGHAFVGQRIDSSLEAWQLPQGGIDAGEDPLVAALRELEEETGIAPRLVEVVQETAGWHYYDLPDDMVGVLWKGRYGGQRQKWYRMRFLGSDADINLQTEHPEFRDWRWAEPETLVRMAVPFKHTLYTTVLAELMGAK